jgi:hypothetical protein
LPFQPFSTVENVNHDIHTHIKTEKEREVSKIINFDIFTAVKIHFVEACVIIPRYLIDGYQRFR